MSRSGDEERARVAHVYGGYARDPSKQHSWSAENRGNAAIREELVEAVFAMAGGPLQQARRILDVGCGSGWWLERLAADPRVCARLEGVELLGDRVEAARRRVPEAVIETGDARALPYADGTFDVVTQFTVLSSLSDRGDVRRALGEAARVVCPGGSLIVWEPRVPNPRNRLTLFISRRLLRDTLGEAELEVISTTALPALARRLGPHTERIYSLLVRVPVLRTHRLVRIRPRRPS